MVRILKEVEKMVRILKEVENPGKIVNIRNLILIFFMKRIFIAFQLRNLPSYLSNDSIAAVRFPGAKCMTISPAVNFP